jgi:hypothetical protein
MLKEILFSATANPHKYDIEISIYEFQEME